MTIVRNPFDEKDLDNLSGPAQAFQPEHHNPAPTYAVQNHLALEVVAHLANAGVPIMFQGGTALQTKLKQRTRFSVDVDIRSTDPGAVEESLHGFVERFPRSGIKLLEPPDSLKIDGVRHTLQFPKAADPITNRPLPLLVEVVPTDDVDQGTEPLSLTVEGMEWGCTVPAPTLEGFVAQKLCVLGPNTLGKAVGPNETHARQNQSVCKQIHDLGRLLLQDLNGETVHSLYMHEIKQANHLRNSDFNDKEALSDAARLIRHLREPRPPKTGPIEAHALWTGYRDSQRWIRNRDHWTPMNYRTTGGVIHRMVQELRQDRLRWSLIARPLHNDPPLPQETAKLLDKAVSAPEEWVASDRFAGDIRTAWAWSPQEYW